MPINKIKHSCYEVELRHLAVCALLFLAVNGIKGSPSYQTRKLHKWLLTARKTKKFSRLVASDLDELIQKSSSNIDVVNILLELNSMYGKTKVDSNKNRLFDLLKLLEVYENIKSIFVSDDHNPIKEKKGDR